MLYPIDHKTYMFNTIATKLAITIDITSQLKA